MKFLRKSELTVLDTEKLSVPVIEKLLCEKKIFKDNKKIDKHVPEKLPKIDEKQYVIAYSL